MKSAVVFVALSSLFFALLDADESREQLVSELDLDPNQYNPELFYYGEQPELDAAMLEAQKGDEEDINTEKRLRFYNPEKRLRFKHPMKRLRFASVRPTLHKRLRFMRNDLH